MTKKVREALNNSTFSIPNYQRDYAWEEKNLDDLWEDLLEAEQAANDQMGHFLGTIVVSKNPKNPEIYDIIDGQQRFTTIFMLQYALSCKSGKLEKNTVLFRDDNNKLRLQVQDENKDFFEKILKQAEVGKPNLELEKESKTQGQEKLYNVFKAILSHMDGLETNRALELFKILGNMSIMWLEEQNSGRAIRMFQTVNDRGVPLSILDKLKALLILYSNKFCNGELDNTISERFGKIFKISMDIKKHQITPSLGSISSAQELESRIFNYHSLGQQFGELRNSADTHYDKLKEVLKQQAKSEKLRQWLDDYSKDLLEFFETFLKLLNRANENIELFKIFIVLKINTYFYAPLVRMEMNGLLDDECLKLFAQAEIMFYSLGKRPNSYAFNLKEAVNLKENFKAKIVEYCNECVECNREVFASSISKRDNYSLGKYFHYLFLTYHNVDIKECQGLVNETYALTIEHIVPQNVVSNGSLKNYGFEDEDEFYRLKDTFGNLIPLERAYNSECGDRSLEEKKRIYVKSKLFYNGIFANSENFLSFGKKQIEEENEKFSEWAKEFFRE